VAGSVTTWRDQTGDNVTGRAADPSKELALSRPATSELYPHQLTGIDFLMRRDFACLWDSPGLGKTCCAIRAIDALQAEKVLIICPAAVRSVWADEIALWSQRSLPVHIEYGYPRNTPQRGITIIGHAALSSAKGHNGYGLRYLKQGRPYDVVVLDEQHLGFKDQGAQRARNFFFPDGVCERAKHVWCLTGTPLVNSAADLWLTAYGMMGTPDQWTDWCRKYTVCKRDNFAPGGFKPTGIRQTDKLVEMFWPYALRRTLDSVGIELPELTVSDVPIKIDNRRLMVINRSLADWDPAHVGRVLAERGEIHDPALATARREIGLSKVPQVVHMAAHLLQEGSGPVVVAFQHTDVRKFLAADLQGMGYRVGWIDGKIPPTRVRTARKALADGEIDVLLLQTDCGGVGLSLVESCRMIVAELPWTSVALHQVIKRLHRIGAISPVTAYVVKLHGCWLDELMSTTITRKDRAASEFLDGLTVDA